MFLSNNCPVLRATLTMALAYRKIDDWQWRIPKTSISIKTWKPRLLHQFFKNWRTENILAEYEKLDLFKQLDITSVFYYKNWNDVIYPGQNCCAERKTAASLEWICRDHRNVPSFGQKNQTPSLYDRQNRNGDRGDAFSGFGNDFRW